jgi:hypothetical protein
MHLIRRMSWGAFGSIWGFREGSLHPTVGHAPPGRRGGVPRQRQAVRTRPVLWADLSLRCSHDER